MLGFKIPGDFNIKSLAHFTFTRFMPDGCNILSKQQCWTGGWGGEGVQQGWDIGKKINADGKASANFPSPV
jgi:hypothetical protein